MRHAASFRARQGGSITSVEAFVLALMATLVVAIAIPSYMALRERSNDASARAQVRQAVEAVETYRAERGSYAGLSLGALVRLDPRLETSTIAVDRSGAGGYCVEASAGGRTWHADGPGGDVSSGGC